MEKTEKELRTTLCLVLLAVTTVVYFQVCTHEFINYDDSSFVSGNAHSNTGLSPDNLKWAFTTLNGDTSYWHPLTWLTYQIDTQMFGLNPGAIHLTNMLFHLASSVLLLIALHQMTGRIWRSAMVAALFALHPLHVESVAWASERKSLVCTFFWMWTLLAYIRYTRQKTGWNYLLLLLCFAASLMGKPMAVTLPFVLLLLDYWPLRRLQPPKPEPPSLGPPATLPAQGSPTPLPANARNLPLMLILEKLPLIALTGFASWLTVRAQSDLGAVASLAHLPVEVRLSNVFAAYFLYLRKMFLPIDLASISTAAE